MRVNLTIEVPDSAVLRGSGALSPAAPCAPPFPHALGAISAAPQAVADCIERWADNVAVASPGTGMSMVDTLRALADASGRLPAHTSPRTRYVHHGALRVPALADAAFTQAARYLSRDSVMRGIIAKVEHSHTQYTLRIVHNDNDRYVPWTHTIEWDPQSAMRTTRGGRQTPALGLGHELDHAAEPARLRDAGEVKRLPRYDNAEERRVILGSETHAARTLGEATRTNHRGSCYRVASPVVC
jgi:hypothetical protein